MSVEPAKPTRRHARQGRRGQGTVELALGLTLLVPVLMIGWSFAESGVMAMKVVEASESALWNATADQRAGSLAAAGPEATTRYADLDGRRSTPGGGGRKGVDTYVHALRVECATASIGLRQPLILNPVVPPPFGARCSATAEIELFGGFTRTVCSRGRPDGKSGACAASSPMIAMDDGALRDHNNCTVTVDGSPCENPEYWRKVDMLYQANSGAQGTSALRLVQDSLRGLLPLHARTALDTYLSFQGEDAVAGPFNEAKLYIADQEKDRWATTPYLLPAEYVASHAQRSGCYLGLDCNSQSIDKP